MFASASVLVRVGLNRRTVLVVEWRAPPGGGALAEEDQLDEEERAEQHRTVRQRRCQRWHPQRGAAELAEPAELADGLARDAHLGAPAVSLRTAYCVFSSYQIYERSRCSSVAAATMWSNNSRNPTRLSVNLV